MPQRNKSSLMNGSTGITVQIDLLMSETIRRLNRWGREVALNWSPEINIIHPKRSSGSYADISEESMVTDQVVLEIEKESPRAAECLCINYFHPTQTTEWKRRLSGMSRYQFLDYLHEGEKAAQQFFVFIEVPLAFLETFRPRQISKRMVKHA